MHGDACAPAVIQGCAPVSSLPCGHVFYCFWHPSQTNEAVKSSMRRRGPLIRLLRYSVDFSGGCDFPAGSILIVAKPSSSQKLLLN